MSDKLQEDFDIYYLELKNFTENFKTGSHEIETDKMYSRSGKHEKIAELETKHLKSVSDLGDRFTAEFDKRVSRINDYITDQRPDPILDSIKKRFAKGENLSTDENNKLLLSEMRETKEIMRKSNFQNMLSGADQTQLRSTAQALSDGEDIERLGWLQEVAKLRGDSMMANSLEAQINGVRDSIMSDEKRNLQTISERIQKGVKLFEYSLERSKRGDFVDARQDEV